LTSTPLSNYYLCRKLQAEDRIGEIYLPPSSVEEPTDALVVSAGPGRVLDSGQRYPMQAQPGDRLITLPQHFHEERGYRGAEGYIRDEDVVGIVRGPEHDTLEPAGDWVLIAPDAPERMSAGGVLLPSYTLKGGEARDGRRGEELYREFVQMGRKHFAEHRDQYEMQRLFKREVSALSPADQQALSEAYEQKGETGWQYLLTRRSLEAPKSGVVLGVGPGRVAGTQERGRGITHWRLMLNALRQRVHWSAKETVELHVSGEARVLVKADDLDAVEVG
jgi:co-chaperonin GroES (HSP10)